VLAAAGTIALGFAAGLVVGALTTGVVYADRWADPVGAIYAAADNNGVAPAVLLALAECESRFNPSARGDYGRSHGLMQLNDRATGLLHHFYQQGYDDPYDPEQAADYVARVAAGEWAREGVTLGRWSCYRGG